MTVVLVVLGLAVMLVATAFAVLIAIAAATEVFPPRRPYELHEDGGTCAPESGRPGMTTVS
jgi:hypothetical protein